MFPDTIHAKGAAWNNTWGFSDGTVHPISWHDTSKESLQWPQKTTCSKVSVNYYLERNDLKFIWPSRAEKSWCYDVQNERSHAHSRKCFFRASAWKALYIWRSSIPFKMIFISTIHGSTPYTQQQQQPFNDSMVKAPVSMEWLSGNVINNF